MNNQFLSHFSGSQWSNLSQNYWEELIPIIKQSAAGAEYYDTQSTLNWIIESVRVGYKLGAAALNDSAVQHDVNEVRLDIIENSLIVCDDQHTHIIQFVESPGAFGHDAQGIDVESGIRLIHDGDLWLKNRHLQNLCPLLLATRKPFIQVTAGHFVVNGQAIHLFGQQTAKFGNGNTRIFGVFRFAARVDGLAQKFSQGDAGHGRRILKRQEQTGAGAFTSRRPWPTRMPMSALVTLLAIELERCAVSRSKPAAYRSAMMRPR